MKSLYLLVLGLTLLTIAHAQTTVSFTADKDNTMYAENSSLSSGAAQDFFAGATGNGAVRRGLLHFNLSSIPSNATVTAVSIQLNCNKSGGAPAGIRVYKATADWGQGTSDPGVRDGRGTAATTNDATWSHRFYNTTSWSNPGGDYVGVASASTALVGLGPVNLSSAGLVSDVQAFVSNSANNFGWVITGTAEGSLATALRFSSRENSVTSERPTITVTYTVTAPVSLKSFTGTMKGNDALISWQTASEQNSDYFDVQYSRNGEAFTSIGKVQAAGNSNTLQSYSFVQSNLGTGKYYYRLVQHDLDGKVFYSGIVILTAGKEIQLQVAPNPASERINITSKQSLAGARYQLIGSGGQQAASGVLDNTQQVNISRLAPGMYQLVVITADAQVWRTQLMKR